MSYDPNNPWGDQGQNPGGADPNSPPPPGYGAPPPNYQQYPPQGGYPPPRYPMGMQSPEQQKLRIAAIVGIVIGLCSLFQIFLGLVALIIGIICVVKKEKLGYIGLILGAFSTIIDIAIIATI